MVHDSPPRRFEDHDPLPSRSTGEKERTDEKRRKQKDEHWTEKKEKKREKETNGLNREEIEEKYFF